MSERNEFWDGSDRRGVSISSIEKILDKFDAHFKEEANYRREFGERFVSIESDLSSVSSSMKKLADVLERLTVIEERDRMHNKSLGEINSNLVDLKKHVEEDSKEMAKKVEAVDAKVNKWIYTASGITTTLVIVWSLLGGVVASKLSDTDKVIEAVKIHLATDLPAGWPTTAPHK